ncbi:MAG: bifunctional glutamate N-acetyltransferase/amino-acid acetyltransferase ArgJ [Calditerrivibrio sp.]|nr:bifunctional glutamate N-acetyltransferase/amino-acid acetyltransferase ArgJ [Calditerrivibrio sp.]
MKLVENGGVCTPLGFSSAAVSADIKGNKSGKLDLAILISEVPCNVAAVFTTNKVKAAPVIAGLEQIKSCAQFYGILVNSGNANACTGKQGIVDYHDITKNFEKKLNLPPGSLLMASTGVIGVRLPVEKFYAYTEALIDKIDDEDDDFTKAIMTTDTKPKKIAVLVETKNGVYVIGAAAKGAGMISPSMATMLSFITTDAVIDKDLMQTILSKVVEKSFNSITVDGDMSTNDSVFLFSNGLSGIKLTTQEELQEFENALLYVCNHLSRSIVLDGEGATKLVHILVKNAKTYQDAKTCASKIANSPLVKTMFFGSDPNWGRLMASIGASMIDIDPEKIDIYFDNLKYVENSRLIDPCLEKDVHEIMLKNEYIITIDLKVGNAEAQIMTCDFSYDYVKINADYRS